MKLELERQNFLKAWQTAEKFAAAKTAKDSTRGVLITASDDNTVILEATDLKTSVRCKAQGANVIESGFAVIPASILGEILKKLPDSENGSTLLLEVNSERGFLNAGRHKTRFAVIPTDEFPKIPESSGAENVCDVNAPTLAKIIAEGSSAASQPQDFPKYLGTCLLRINDGFIIGVSTDGRRLSLSKSACSIMKDDDLLLPAAALKELGKIIASSCSDDDSVKILADSSTAWFGLRDIEFSIRRIDSVFPKFERILNTEVRTSLSVNSAELSSSLERIDIIAKTTTAHIMAVSLNPDGELRITARAPELGTASEVVQAGITGDKMQLGFNVSYFLDGLKALGGKDAVIEFSGEEGQTRMKRAEDDNFLYMLMPARLSPQDTMTDEELGDFTTDINAAGETGESNETSQAESNTEGQPVNDWDNSVSSQPEQSDPNNQGNQDNQNNQNDTPF